MTIRSKTLRETLWLACCHSLLAWTVYAIAEFVFSSVWPALMRNGEVYAPLQYDTTAFLFGIYEITGIALGLSIGALLYVGARRNSSVGRLDATVVCAACGQLGFLAIYLVNIARTRPAVAIALPLALLAGIATLNFVGMQDVQRYKRLRPVLNPWTTALLVVGIPWLTKESLWERGLLFKLAAAAAAITLTLAVSFRLFRVFREGRINAAPTRALFAAASLAIASFGFSYALDERPAMPQPHSTGAASSSPDIILISLDTVRADHLPIYGYERDTTPNLRKFASEADVYTRCISTSDMTLGSHASMFTGLYASWHGAHYDHDHPLGRPLPANFETLAQKLQKKQYTTIGVASNRAYLQPAFGLNRGFQAYDVRAPFFPETADFYLRSGIRSLLRPLLDRKFGLLYRRAVEINDSAVHMLENSRRRNTPVFLFLNYMDAHWPYTPPQPYDTMYPGKLASFSEADYSSMSKTVMKLRRPIRPAERQHLISQYDGGIAYLDSQLGVLFQRLKQLDLYDNSLIIVTSDHGEVFGERNLIGHPVSAYQDQVHVPLLMKRPHQTKGRVEDALVSGVDIFATVLEAAGEPVPAGVQGRSLWGTTAPQDRTVLAEAFEAQVYASWHSRFKRDERALFSGSMKLVTSTAGKRELYDLSTDPNEQRNLYQSDRPEATLLSLELDHLLKSAPGIKDRPGDLDKATIERLRSLGYVQ